MKCKKIDLRKINFNKSATWNVWWQFGIDIDTINRRIEVIKHYMPQKEQDKLRDYIIKNWKKMKIYKHHTRNKKIIQDSLSWEVLCYFPTNVEKS